MAEPHNVKQLLLSYRIGGRCHAFPQNLHLSLTQSCHRGAVLKLFHRHEGRGVFDSTMTIRGGSRIS